MIVLQGEYNPDWGAYYRYVSIPSIKHGESLNKASGSFFETAQNMGEFGMMFERIRRSRRADLSNAASPHAGTMKSRQNHRRCLRVGMRHHDDLKNHAIVVCSRNPVYSSQFFGRGRIPDRTFFRVVCGGRKNLPAAPRPARYQVLWKGQVRGTPAPSVSRPHTALRAHILSLRELQHDTGRNTAPAREPRLQEHYMRLGGRAA